MTCATCEKHGEPMYCGTCNWKGYLADVRTKEVAYCGPSGESRTEESLICPECHDEADVSSLEHYELTEVYGEECPDCPQDGDIHVYPVGKVPEASGDQPEHDLRGSGCWCKPVVEIVGGGKSIIIHEAVEVS